MERDQDQIEKDLRNKLITPQEAFSLIISKKQKPWTTREWKRKRDSLVGKKCVQCGSENPPLVLQHLWQPNHIKIHISNIRARYRKVYEQQHPRPIIPEPPHQECFACPNPKCGSVNIQKNIQDELWVCNNKKCGKQFETPIVVLALTPEQMAEWSRQKDDATDEWYQTFRKISDDEVITEAVLQNIADYRRYISMVDTTTFCKICADQWNMKSKRLCPSCMDYTVLAFGQKCTKCRAIVEPIKPSPLKQ